MHGWCHPSQGGVAPRVSAARACTAPAALGGLCVGRRARTPDGAAATPFHNCIFKSSLKHRSHSHAHTDGCAHSGHTHDRLSLSLHQPLLCGRTGRDGGLSGGGSARARAHLSKGPTRARARPPASPLPPPYSSHLRRTSEARSHTLARSTQCFSKAVAAPPARAAIAAPVRWCLTRVSGLFSDGGSSSLLGSARATTPLLRRAARLVGRHSRFSLAHSDWHTQAHSQSATALARAAGPTGPLRPQALPRRHQCGAPPEGGCATTHTHRPSLMTRHRQSVAHSARAAAAAAALGLCQAPRRRGPLHSSFSMEHSKRPLPCPRRADSLPRARPL